MLSIGVRYANYSKITLINNAENVLVNARKSNKRLHKTLDINCVTGMIKCLDRNSILNCMHDSKISTTIIRNS